MPTIWDKVLLGIQTKLTSRRHIVGTIWFSTVLSKTIRILVRGLSSWVIQLNTPMLAWSSFFLKIPAGSKLFFGNGYGSKGGFKSWWFRCVTSATYALSCKVLRVLGPGIRGLFKEEPSCWSILQSYVCLGFFFVRGVRSHPRQSFNISSSEERSSGLAVIWYSKVSALSPEAGLTDLLPRRSCTERRPVFLAEAVVGNSLLTCFLPLHPRPYFHPLVEATDPVELDWSILPSVSKSLLGQSGASLSGTVDPLFVCSRGPRLVLCIMLLSCRMAGLTSGSWGLCVPSVTSGVWSSTPATSIGCDWVITTDAICCFTSLVFFVPFDFFLLFLVELSRLAESDKEVSSCLCFFGGDFFFEDTRLGVWLLVASESVSVLSFFLFALSLVDDCPLSDDFFFFFLSLGGGCGGGGRGALGSSRLSFPFPDPPWSPLSSPSDESSSSGLRVRFKHFRQALGLSGLSGRVRPTLGSTASPLAMSSKGTSKSWPIHLFPLNVIALTVASVGFLAADTAIWQYFSSSIASNCWTTEMIPLIATGEYFHQSINSSLWYGFPSIICISNWSGAQLWKVGYSSSELSEVTDPCWASSWDIGVTDAADSRSLLPDIECSIHFPRLKWIKSSSKWVKI